MLFNIIKYIPIIWVPPWVVSFWALELSACLITHWFGIQAFRPVSSSSLPLPPCPDFPHSINILRFGLQFVPIVCSVHAPYSCALILIYSGELSFCGTGSALEWGWPCYHGDRVSDMSVLKSKRGQRAAELCRILYKWMPLKCPT